MDDATSYHDEASHYERPSERLDAMRRTVAKALNSSGHGDFYSEYNDNSQNPQLKIDELVNTIVFSLMRQSLEFLKESEGEATMACLVGLMARAVSRFVVTEQAKVAIRVSAKEATAGLWDGFHRRLDEVVMKVPRVVLWLGLVVVGRMGFCWLWGCCCVCGGSRSTDLFKRKISVTRCIRTLLGKDPNEENASKLVTTQKSFDSYWDVRPSKWKDK